VYPARRALAAPPFDTARIFSNNPRLFGRLAGAIPPAGAAGSEVKRGQDLLAGVESIVPFSEPARGFTRIDLVCCATACEELCRACSGELKGRLLLR
jgi:hypothetical protein